MRVHEARQQLTERLAQSITGHDKLGMPGFEMLDERVQNITRAIDALIVAHIRALPELQTPEEPRGP